MKKEWPFYYNKEDDKNYLELHANHSAWKLKNDNKTPADWVALVEEAVLIFESETKTRIYLLGRSGRHVCVEDTHENRQRYAQLKKLAQELEKDAIAAYNSDNPLQTGILSKGRSGQKPHRRRI